MPQPLQLWFDEKLKAFQELVNQRLPGSINRISCRRCSEPDMVALLRQFSDRHPGQLWLYTAANQQWRAVARVMSGIDPALMASVDFQRMWRWIRAFGQEIRGVTVDGLAVDPLAPGR